MCSGAVDVTKTGVEWWSEDLAADFPMGGRGTGEGVDVCAEARDGARVWLEVVVVDDEEWPSRTWGKWVSRSSIALRMAPLRM
jgi:hypothetical protein